MLHALPIRAVFSSLAVAVVILSLIHIYGSLGALHWVGWQSVGMGGALDRLTVFKSPFIPAPLLVALWLLYLSGTVGAVACACARKYDSAAKSQG